ncbi:hypothetical protein GCM10027073_03460 [Streptomyces chlorus]
MAWVDMQPAYGDPPGPPTRPPAVTPTRRVRAAPARPRTLPTRGRDTGAAHPHGTMVSMTSTPRPSRLDPEIAARLKRSPDGLLPAIAQQYDTHEVLMLGWMDDEALHRTLTTGRCTYWSRSRQEYWVKGDTSGHVQHVKSVALDCDADTLLVKVDQVGAACHTGARTCFDADVLLTDTPADRAKSGAHAPGQ